MYPPGVERDGNCCYTYLTSKEFPNPANFFHYSKKTRRVTRVPALKNGDSIFGTELSWYDYHFHQPWDNEYRILGEDNFKGNDCLVIERVKSKIYPDFYMGKSIIWMERHNFLRLHEEQFDKEGKFFKLMDRKWQQLKPSNHWVFISWNIITLKTKARTFVQQFNYELDTGRREMDFDAIRMTEEKFWKKCENGHPPINKLSDFPSTPEVRKKFWNKLGINSEIKQ